MKLTLFVALLVVAPYQTLAYSCADKTVEVWVANGVGMTGDGLQDPDPYVKVNIGGTVQKTRVIHSNRNPVWWQRFRFYSPGTNSMRIEVWEQDGGLRGADDHLGTCIKQLSSYGTGFRNVDCNVQNNGHVKLLYRCYNSRGGYGFQGYRRYRHGSH